MKKETNLTKREISKVLKEALQIFCDPNKDLRPALATPFRQKEFIMASDGHILIRIRAKEAGCAIGPFKVMDQFNALKAVPTIGFKDLLASKSLHHKDIIDTIAKMKAFEEEKKEPTLAKLCGIKLTMEALSKIEVVMRIFGVETARLVWHRKTMVSMQLYNNKGQDVVTIVHMGLLGRGDEHIFDIPTTDYNENDDVTVDWQRGIAAWNDIKEEKKRKEEEERMAKRGVYLVQMVKTAYIPVYAKDADEARRLADSECWFEPEDDGDDEWTPGDEVPEDYDLEDLSGCYKHIITPDGIVERDEIYKMEQIREDWMKEQEKEK